MHTSQTIKLINIEEMCRLCANKHENLTGIYTSENNDLAAKINFYLPIKVDKADKLPLNCCRKCVSAVIAWHDFYLTCLESDKTFRNYQICNEELISKEVDSEIYSAECSQTNEKYFESDLFDKNNALSSDEDESEEIKTTDNDNTNIDYLQVVDLSAKSCILCQLSFSTRTQLKNHVLEVHNIKQTKLRRKKVELNAIFACTVCKRSFTRKFDMQRHMLKKHPETSVEPSIRSKNSELLKKCKVVDSELSYYECDVCHTKYKSSSSFVLHYNIHINKKLHCCHLCGKNFQRGAHLKRHVDRLHYGIRRYSCDYCDQTFTSKTTKDEHLNTHTNSRPYMCDTCGKSFRQSSSLYVHKMFHKDIFPFSCNVCEKKFRRMGELKKHKFIHTGERQYSCEVCKRPFRLKQDLKRHMKTHAAAKAVAVAE
ncbi:uncharacterized protein [Diabrotica undecimpunctata]|uniref:uncharacterized protein n=1 Tax=Diabrotica undecimpunctata TaxID=50387 RepID=UPI003B63BD2E